MSEKLNSTAKIGGAAAAAAALVGILTVGGGEATIDQTEAGAAEFCAQRVEAAVLDAREQEQKICAVEITKIKTPVAPIPEPAPVTPPDELTAEIERLIGVKARVCKDKKQAERCEKVTQRLKRAERAKARSSKEASKSMVNITDVNVANPGDGSIPIKDGSVNVRLFTDVDPVDVFAAQFESKGRTQEAAVTNRATSAPWWFEVTFKVNTIELTGLTAENVTALSNTAPSTPATGESVFPGTNMLWVDVIGHRTDGQNFPAEGWLDGPSDGWSEAMADILAQAPNAFTDRVRPVIGKSIRWADTLVNENLVMTVAEMADHTHPNYVWNQPGGDGLTEALNSATLVNNDAYLSLVMADSHSGARNAVPQFMIDADLSFVGTSDPRNHVLKFYNTQARNLATAWFTAVFNKWGSHPRMHSFWASEYFDGSNHPADYDAAGQLQGRAAMWTALVAAMPRDANGNHKPVIQANARFGHGVNIQTVINSGLALGQSDPDVFHHGCENGGGFGTNGCDAGSLSGNLQDGWGVVPIMASQDDRYATDARVTGPYPSPNSQGFSANARVEHTIPLTLAYRATTVRMNAFMFQLRPSLPGWNNDALIQGLQEYGTGGSKVADIGGVGVPLPIN